MRNWPRALAAVLAGNLIYFVLLMRALPAWLRHSPFRIDAGLLLDFVLCAAIYLLLGRFVRERSGGEGKDPR